MRAVLGVSAKDNEGEQLVEARHAPAAFSSHQPRIRSDRQRVRGALPATDRADCRSRLERTSARRRAHGPSESDGRDSDRSPPTTAAARCPSMRTPVRCSAQGWTLPILGGIKDGKIGQALHDAASMRAHVPSTGNNTGQSMLAFAKFLVKPPKRRDSAKTARGAFLSPVPVCCPCPLIAHAH